MLVMYPLSPAIARALASRSRLTGLGGAGELDEPVALDRHLPCDGFFGLGDLLVDAALRPARPISSVWIDPADRTRHYVPDSAT